MKPTSASFAGAGSLLESSRIKAHECADTLRFSSRTRLVKTRPRYGFLPSQGVFV